MYRFNLNGYICLPASLCWGAFSLVMLRLIHPVVSGWVAMLAPAAALTAALALSAFFAVDLLVSLRQAVDMRSLLQSLSASSRHIARLQKRYEVEAAFAPGGLVRGIETVQSRLQALRQQRRQLLRTLSVEASGDVDAARLVREELSAMLERGRAVCAEALLRAYGCQGDGSGGQLASAVAKNLTKRQIMGTIELLEKYRGECVYNVGPSHVLGALAVELEGIL